LQQEIEISPPKIPDDVTSVDIITGYPVAPLDRLKIMDEDTWEEFTAELTYYWKTQYSSVVRCGGGGDKGRDVIAYNPSGDWENFQCKHYSRQLSLNDALFEIGKLIYYANKGDYTLPKKYYFVTPLNVSSNLLSYLMNPERLKEPLFDRWNSVCRNKITRKETIEYSTLSSFVDNNVDFSIFENIPTLKLIDLHGKTPYHSLRFGGVHKKRPKSPEPPKEIEIKEQVYLSLLFAAFSEYKKEKIDISKLDSDKNLYDEFISARKNFYSADSLERFSRDWLPTGSYSELLDECYEAILSTLHKEYINGYMRYLEVSSQAARIDYPSHPLHYCLLVKDKKGFCHQLANIEKIKWATDND